MGYRFIIFSKIGPEVQATLKQTLIKPQCYGLGQNGVAARG